LYAEGLDSPKKAWEERGNSKLDDPNQLNCKQGELLGRG